MNKDVIELLLRIFTPKGVLVMAVILGIFTVIYTAIIRFFFDKKLKSYESRLTTIKDKDLEDIKTQHTIALKTLEAQLTAQNQVLIQNLQTESNRALKTLEIELTSRSQADLQRIQDELGERRSENQARRDYEYEARKRLYHECEPLIFQFVQLCDNALHRIRSLARSARHGTLLDWLADDGYYLTSTMYRLLAPMVVYKLICRRLTIVDLTLDKNIAVHYELAKNIGWSFSADFDFAWGLKVFPLGYDPNNPDWTELRKRQPAVYWRQGLPVGRFDNAVESLISQDPELDGHQRIISFGEFESGLHTTDSTISKTFAMVRDIMIGFHPEVRPVLWRMLITQAHIYDAIIRYHTRRSDNRDLVIRPIPPQDRGPLYWIKNPNASQQQQLEQPFTVAEAYLQKELDTLFLSSPGN